MSFLAEHLLSLVIFLPLAGALLGLSFPRHEHSGVRGFAMAVTLGDLLLALWMWWRFDPSQAGLQLVERAAWIPSLGVGYAVAVDGLSVLLVVLTTLLAPLVILSTYRSVGQRIREYVVCLLLLQTGMLGAFLAVDLFLFYVFWELLLIPMVFLIGVWGSSRRTYAALKFFLYTMAGSLLMLVAILYVVWAVREPGGITFDWLEVSQRLGRVDLGGAEPWLFWAFTLAFAIKVPLFPLHTWLPDAHVEAPTGGSVVLAGVLLKLGTFGLLRYSFWLFPDAAVEAVPAVALLAVIGIIYGALVAMVQDDLKRLVAYSSVSHLGFVVLGACALTVTGLTGSVVQMINHGVSTAALFFLVGVLYDRRHTRLIADFGGLAKVMPLFSALWVLITLSSIGVPGLNGFVGELLILLGAFESTGVGIALSTGDVAWAGIAAVMVVAGGGVVLVTLSLLGPGRDNLGPGTKLLAIAGAATAAVLLAAPPWGDFTGGLLVRPLALAVGREEAFGEVLATLAVLAASGVIFAAVYLLWATQRVFFGPVQHHDNLALPDLGWREGIVIGALALIAIGTGLYPRPLIDSVEPTVTVYARRVRAEAGLAMEGRPAAPRQAQPSVGPPIRRMPSRPGMPVDRRELLQRLRRRMQ